MIGNKKISLILPCRNEENAIRQVIQNLPPTIDEILVIDNCSTDHTAQVAQELGARVFIEPRKKHGIGYGFALATGINNASGDILVCMDGDGSYPVKKINPAIRHLLSQKIDFISCNRLPVQDPQKMSLVRTSGVKTLNILLWFLYGYQIKDSLTGMWVFRRQAVPDLTIFDGGWNFSLEIKLSAITNRNINFAEFYIPYHDRIFDQSKQNLFNTGWEHFRFLFSYKINKLLKGFKWVPVFGEPAVSLLEVTI